MYKANVAFILKVQTQKNKCPGVARTNIIRTFTNAHISIIVELIAHKRVPCSSFLFSMKEKN